MPRSKKNTKKSQTGPTNGPAASALVYRGSFIPPMIVKQEQLVLKLCNLSVTVSSNSSGVINQYLGIGDPSGAANWASLAAVFDEFRVLAVRAVWTPSNGYNKVVATQTCINPYYIVLDRDSTGTLSGVTAAMFYDSVEQFDLERPFVYEKFKMNGAKESAFQTTASPTNFGAYKTISSGLTPSLQYGTFLLQTLVQFRASA